MDDEDYSWVRRTRFSHSVVRSNSGREQFGAFVEQFNRGAELRQKGSASGFKLHGLNMEPGARFSTSALPRSTSLGMQPKPKDLFSDAKPTQHKKAAGDRPPPDAKPTQNEKAAGDRPPQQASAIQDDAKAANGKKGSCNLSVAVPREPTDDESPGALEFSFHPDEQSLKLQRACSSPAPFPKKEKPGIDALTRSSSLSVLCDGPMVMQRARSPLPSRHIPEVFQEAKSASKRFSTPPPPRRSASLRDLNGNPPAPLRAPGKLKHRKENGRAKVAAVEVLEKWTVDRSQLLIGHRFASGAHSRLFHGIYKEQPVAVKFIRQPDDEEDAELAAQLEKQFNTEVTTLSRLHHPNVIKVIHNFPLFRIFCGYDAGLILHWLCFYNIMEIVTQFYCVLCIFLVILLFDKLCLDALMIIWPTIKTFELFVCIQFPFCLINGTVCRVAYAEPAIKPSDYVLIYLNVLGINLFD
jgi:hypothetical protein